MGELLHTWALAPAAVGTCCMVADRGRPRMPELAASMLMLVAMLDATFRQALAPIYWTALLLASAMALAAVRGRMGERQLSRAHPPQGPSKRATTAMTMHTALGLVVMGALVLTMGAPDSGAMTGHHHGVSAAALVGLVVAGSTAYGVGSAALAVRAHGQLDRMQYALMGISTAAMGVALVL